MELRRELILSVGALVALNVLLAAGAIGLFVRMGPAINRILAENDYSIAAAEEMLGELALAGTGSMSDEGRTRFLAALKRAENNVTEASERPALAGIRAHLDSALAGETEGRAKLVEHARAFISVNRGAMRAVDNEARRLGRAGAWASVLVGLLSLFASLTIIARLRRRLLVPLLELYDVLVQVGAGDRFRRARVGSAPTELRACLRMVNHLLDEYPPDTNTAATHSDKRPG